MSPDQKLTYQSYLNKALDNIDKIFGKLNIEYDDSRASTIELVCPIHGSQMMGNSIIYKDSGVWLCFSGDCHTKYSKSILGLIAGCLDKVSKYRSIKDVYEFIDNENLSLKIIREVRTRELIFKDEKSKPECIIPSPYFLRRGYSPESLTYFEVGDCQRGHYSDRAIVPVRYIDGQYMGFSARIHWPLCKMCGYHHSRYTTCISKDHDFHFMYRKWYHSKGLQKTMTLYGIDKIKNISKIALVEGPGCVWKLHQYGIPAVACMGKDINKNQIELLKGLSIKSILFLPDNDEAGQQFKQSFIKRFYRDFKIYLPKLTSKDISEMNDQDIQHLIVEEWKKI